LWHHTDYKCGHCLLQQGVLQSPSDSATYLASKAIHAFHGSRRFMTVYTTAGRLSLSSATLIQSTPLHHISLRSNLINFHPRLGFQQFLFPQVSSQKSCMHFFPPHTCYMPRLSHPLCLD